MRAMSTNLIAAIRERLLASREAGYVAGGSGHLAHVDIANLEIVNQQPVTREGKPAIDITYRYEVWIDREFEMTPDTVDMFKEVHRERVVYQDGAFFPATGDA